MFLSILKEPFQLLDRCIIFWPSTKLGYFLRKAYYKRLLGKLGTNPIFESGVRFGGPAGIQVGDHCILGRNVNINAGECKGIFIGDHVAIADGVYVRSANHKMDKLDVPMMFQGHECSIIEYDEREFSVVIEDDVWVGARAIILSGAHIGKGSVISAGAVVSGKIPPNSIVLGNPGRVIANREKRIRTNEKI